MSRFAEKDQAFLGSLVNQRFRFRTCYFFSLNVLETLFVDWNSRNLVLNMKKTKEMMTDFRTMKPTRILGEEVER